MKMKTKMKINQKIKMCLSILMGIALMMTAVSCGSSYRSDVTSESLINQLISTLEQDGEDHYHTADGETYSIYFGEEDAYANVTDCCIAYHDNGTNVDQFGIFRVKDGQSTEPIRRMVQEYVDGQSEYLYSFASNYQQDELEKIRNTHVVTYGQYVLYTILDSSDYAAVANALQEAIAQ